MRRKNNLGRALTFLIQTLRFKNEVVFPVGARLTMLSMLETGGPGLPFRHGRHSALTQSGGWTSIQIGT
jgi:hypothetical protein